MAWLKSRKMQSFPNEHPGLLLRENPGALKAAHERLEQLIVLALVTLIAFLAFLVAAVQLTFLRDRSSADRLVIYLNCSSPIG